MDAALPRATSPGSSPPSRTSRRPSRSAKEPEGQARGALQLSYKLQDDDGVRRASAGAIRRTRTQPASPVSATQHANPRIRVSVARLFASSAVDRAGATLGAAVPAEGRKCGQLFRSSARAANACQLFSVEREGGQKP